MYQNIFVKRNKRSIEVHLWDSETGYEKFQYKPYAYSKSASGTYRSLYGDKLKKVTYWTEQDVMAGKIFESDIPMETRILVDRYSDSDEISTGHKKVFFDIEVEVKDGFPDPMKAENKITSIALYDCIGDSYFVFILSDIQNRINDNVTITSFDSEYELLKAFLQKYLEIQPTILSGWNIDGFDIPYLYNRLNRVLGYAEARCLSPIGEIRYLEYKGKYKIAGVSSLDYLPLYKKFTYTQQSSYRLDYIGQKEVGIGKIEYHGTLNDLYKNDIEKFIEYNLVDVKIIKALDDKLKLIELAMGIAHVGHVPYEDVYFSSRYLEGAILVYLKKIDVISPNKQPQAKELMDNSPDSFTGAFVKEPVAGRHDWVYDLDLTSMYPSIIMTLNISPEMKLGKLDNWDSKDFIKSESKNYLLTLNGKVKNKFNTEELKQFLDNQNVSISANGVIYKTDKMGLIPSLLSKWFDERVEYKTLAKKYGNADEAEKYEYFNRRQHVQKIILNSMYGVLGLPVFRFYDVDNAEATTITGQELIKFTETIANHYYNKELKSDDKDHVIYVDTDSIFVSALPLVKNRFPNADVTDDEFMTTQILSVAKEVQDFINNGYNYFAKKFLNIKGEHRFDIKQECVAKSAFWVTKKRYGQWIINDGGLTCNKLDVKGFDIVRSNFPIAFKNLMSSILKDILENKEKSIIDRKILDFKRDMKKSDLQDIASPTGVKGLTKYVDKSKKSSKAMFTALLKGAPVHVKAAIAYNDLLKYFKLKNTERIKNNEKIKWVYLKDNPYNVQGIAFKGYDDPPEIMDFIMKYIDYDKILNKSLDNKLQTWYDALQWAEPIDVRNTLERFF
jgi:DNA polymerase elongation subunit (family B)